MSASSSLPAPLTGKAEGHEASFRDPCGRVFRRNGVLYREVTARYRADWDQLVESGLLASLHADGSLIAHDEADPSLALGAEAVRVLAPEEVPFVSYPYEWSFGQLKEAALLTLAVHRRALKHGMVLKDASAYNVQFLRGRPVFIDTLSFERWKEGTPWVAYRQFCQHFLAPLALAATTDVRALSFSRVHLDGLPLDLASSLLPWKTRLRPGLLTHVHLHARAQRRHSGAPAKTTSARMSAFALEALADDLERLVASLSWEPSGTTWADYYNDTNYSPEAFEAKQRLVASFIDEVKPKRVWDLGANNGRFSRLATERGAFTVAFDGDPAAVEQNWREVRKGSETLLLPLVLDLANPSAGGGWEGTERDSIFERGPADLVLALALVHHLAIGNNVPLERVARFLSRIGTTLVVEWVPKEDSQVQRLLAGREDVFDRYDSVTFEAAFASHFDTVRREPIPGSGRVLHLLRRRGEG